MVFLKNSIVKNYNLSKKINLQAFYLIYLSLLYLKYHFFFNFLFKNEITFYFIS